MSKISIYNRASAFVAVVLFVLGFHATALCQDATTTVQSDFEHKVNLYNVNGSPLLNHDAEVKGDPWFLKEWKDAAVFTVANQTVPHISIRIDLQNQLVHFLNPAKLEFVAAAGAIKQVVIFDTVAGVATTCDLRCGFPAIDNQTINSFYQVLSFGKLTLLKSLRKSLSVEHDEFTGDTKKELTLHEEYYFFIGDKMQRIKKDKGFVLGNMQDKRAEIEAFVQKNKLSFKTFEDIKATVDYYNSLQ
jgi:hypothetical protein